MAGRRGAPVAPVDPDSTSEAEQAALRILAAAAQSAAGLRRRLERRGFAPAAAAAATAAMTELGYVDDDALAESIASRRQRAGRGRIRVAAELRARGLGDEAIGAALAAVEPQAEREAALEAARRLVARNTRDIADRLAMQRLGAMLQRRGFDTETVAWVLRELQRAG